MRLIDADMFDKVLSDAQNECKKKSGGNFRYGFLSTVRANMLKQPTVDATPVTHGKWEDVGSLSCRCSECGCKNDRETMFCPNCGAKMDLEDKQ